MKPHKIKTGKNYRGRPRGGLPSPEVRQVQSVHQVEGVDVVGYVNQEGRERVVRLTSFAEWAHSSVRAPQAKAPGAKPLSIEGRGQNKSFYLTPEDADNMAAIAKAHPKLTATLIVRFALALAAGHKYDAALEYASTHRQAPY